MTVGKYCTWRKTPTGQWVVWGRHDILSKALADGLPIQTRRTDDEIQTVYLEHVGDPNWEGWAIAHPVGTTTGEFSDPILLPTVRARRNRTQVRRHGGRQRNQRRRDRMR